MEERGRSRARRRPKGCWRKRLGAWILTAAMTVTSAGFNVSTVYASDDVTFEVSGSELVRAVEEAVADGNVVTPQDLEFTNGKIDRFEELFFGEGTLYEAYPEFEQDGGQDAQARVFVRLPEDADDMYTLTGDEDIIFLYVNNSDGTISCRTNVTRMVDGKEKVKKTSLVTIKSYEAAYGDEEVNIITETQPAQETQAPAESTQSNAVQEETQAPTESAQAPESTQEAEQETTAAGPAGETAAPEESAPSEETEETANPAEESSPVMEEAAETAEEETAAEEEMTAEESVPAETEEAEEAAPAEEKAEEAAPAEDAEEEAEEAAPAEDAEEEVEETVPVAALSRKAVPLVGDPAQETATPSQADEEEKDQAILPEETLPVETSAEEANQQQNTQPAPEETLPAESQPAAPDKETQVQESAGQGTQAAGKSDLAAIGWCSTVKAYTTSLNELKAFERHQSYEMHVGEKRTLECAHWYPGVNHKGFWSSSAPDVVKVIDTGTDWLGKPYATVEAVSASENPVTITYNNVWGEVESFKITVQADETAEAKAYFYILRPNEDKMDLEDEAWLYVGTGTINPEGLLNQSGQPLEGGKSDYALDIVDHVIDYPDKASIVEAIRELYKDEIDPEEDVTIDFSPFKISYPNGWVDANGKSHDDNTPCYHVDMTVSITTQTMATVTYNIWERGENGYTPYQSHIVEKGTTTEPPAVDEVPGYQFVGWYDNPDLDGEPVKFPYTVTDSVNFYGKYEPVEATNAYFYIIRPEKNPDDLENESWLYVGTGSIDTEGLLNQEGQPMQGGQSDVSYDVDKRIITSPDQEDIEAAVRMLYGIGLEEEMELTVTPYKITYPNGWVDAEGGAHDVGIPCYHVDMVVDVSTDQKATVNYWVRDIGQEYELKNTQTVDLGEETNPPQGLYKPGYKLVGWYDNRDLDGKPVEFPYTVNESLNFYAQYVPIENYNVAYEFIGDIPEGVSTPSEASVAEGTEVSLDTTYEKGTTETDDRGTWIFSGWITDDADVQNGTFTMPGHNVEFTGSWELTEEKIVTIQYQSESETKGTVSTPSEAIPVFGPSEGSTAIPEDGYKFTYWTDEAGKMVSENADFIPSKDSETGLYEEATYTAHFTERDDLEFWIRYYYEDASGHITEAEDQMIHGTNGVFGQLILTEQPESEREYNGVHYALDRIIGGEQTVTTIAGNNVVYVYYAIDEKGGTDPDDPNTPDDPDQKPDKDQVIFTYVSDGNGTVEGTVYEVREQEWVDGTAQGVSPNGAVTITPAEGYAFDYWTIDGVDGRMDYTSGMDSFKNGVYTEDTTFRVHFAADQIGTPDPSDPSNPNRPDGIPDKYQVVFTYVSEDVNQGTVGGTTVEVYTAEKNADGSYNTAQTFSPKAEVTTDGVGRYYFAQWNGSDGRVYNNLAELRAIQSGQSMTFTAIFNYRSSGGSSGGSGGGGGGGSTVGSGSYTAETGGPGAVSTSIADEDVPLASLPDQAVTIDPDDVPLAPLPKTGQNSRGAVLAMIAGLAMAAGVLGRKRKEEDA